MQLTIIKNKIRNIERLFYIVLRTVLTFVFGFVLSRLSIPGNLSPFSLSFLSVIPGTSLSLIVYYIGSFFGFLTKAFATANYRYILANSLLFIVITIIGTKRYKTIVYSSVIPSLVCFLSGLLFIIVDSRNIFSVILLLCESVLCGCASYFLNISFCSFYKKCKLDSKDLISINISLILLICALDNYYVLGTPCSMIVISLFAMLSCRFLRSKTAFLFNLSLCLTPIILYPKNELTVLLVTLPMAVCAVVSKYSVKHIPFSYFFVYFSFFIMNIYDFSLNMILSPACAAAIYMLIPKNKLSSVLCHYIELKDTKPDAEDNNKNDQCEKYKDAARELMKIINYNTVKPIVNFYNENIFKRFLYINGCKDVKISNYYSENGKQLVTVNCFKKGDFPFEVFRQKLCKVCNNNFILSEKVEKEFNVFCKYEQSDNYSIECYALCRPKNGESVCGDSITAFKSSNGNYNLLLADGMGSGKEAYNKSSDSITIFKKLILSGVDLSHAVETVNTSLGLLKDQIGFSTLDLCSISLSSAKGIFLKCGAYKSYVVREGIINTISGGGFPLGLDEKVSYSSISYKFLNDDIIIMMSDGLSVCEEKVQHIILSQDYESIEELSRKIIDAACFKITKETDDDMTVLVAHIVKRNSHE